jgi:hypothetical protein
MYTHSLGQELTSNIEFWLFGERVVAQVDGLGCLQGIHAAPRLAPQPLLAHHTHHSTAKRRRISCYRAEQDRAEQDRTEQNRTAEPTCGSELLCCLDQ